MELELRERERKRSDSAPPREITLVAGRGRGSIDKYAAALRQRLRMSTIETPIFEQVIERWEKPWVSRTAVKAVASDAALVRELRRVRGPLHFTNHHFGRYGHFVSQPYLITVHDLLRLFDLRGGSEPFIHRPNARARSYLRLDYAGVGRASRLIAVSDTTRNDLIRHLGIDPARVDRVYEGVDLEKYRPTERRLRDEPYVVFVGTEQPRKNLAGLLQALARLGDGRGDRAPHLVKIGGEGYPQVFRQRTRSEIERLGLGERVTFTGWVSEDDLIAYYSGALCCVLPSFYEGFGFPVLEAMACGCPVVTSPQTATAEVGGKAVLYADPRRPDEIAGAIAHLADDSAARRELIARGLDRAQQFSWEQTAEETRAVYSLI